jgi:hypothetical protein
MKRCAISIILFIHAIVFSVLSQELDFYQPIGFVNPPLRSGHFITSAFYSQQNATTTQVGLKSDRLEQKIALIGYLGLTDYLTLQTNFTLFPDQTIYELPDP